MTEFIGNKYFTKEEMACRGKGCCDHTCYMSPIFMEKIMSARDIAGIPFKINSGYRCRTHNSKVGGKNTSSHIFGLAADIAIDGLRSRYTILEAFFKVGLNRIGIGDSFLHVDDDPDKTPNVIWLY